MKISVKVVLFFFDNLHFWYHYRVFSEQTRFENSKICR